MYDPAWFCARYNQRPSVELARELKERCDPNPDATRHMWDNALKITESHDFVYSVGFAYPNPFYPDGHDWVHISHFLRAPRKKELVSRTMLKVPLTEVKEGAWLWLESGQFDASEPRWASWFIDQCQCALEVLQPDFGYASFARAASKLADRDPTTLAWPTLLLGPGEVERRGREHVLATPAHEVRELIWGGVLVHAAEHPLKAGKRELRRVGEHLGLEVPQ